MQIIPENDAPTSAHIPANKGFVRLVTNLEGLLPEERAAIRSSQEEYLLRTAAYLTFVREGMQGKPYCPFVEFIEKRNGYHVQGFSQAPFEFGFLPYDLYSIAGGLEEKFYQLSPAMTHASQRPDPTVIIAAFSHPEAMSEDFCAELDCTRDFLRHNFLDQGLMLSQMHPFHPRESAAGRGATEGYEARIPMLVVRRMHDVDHVFMTTPLAKATYERIFRREFPSAHETLGSETGIGLIDPETKSDL